MLPAAAFFRAENIAEIVPMFTDPRNLPQELRFLNRTPVVPATDGEILVRTINRVQIADLVADDQRALTYRTTRVQAETVTVPNIKHGVQLTQEDLNKLQSIREGAGVNAAAREVADNLVPSLVRDTVTGVQHRMEALIIAMHCEMGTYNRFGIKISGGWGTPSDLNVTPSVPWTDAANATPVNDIWTVKLQASTRYGTTFNRATMSSQAFRLMIATAEFQTKARTTLPLVYNITNIPVQETGFWKNLAQNVLGIDEIELYDARYWSQDESGNTTSAPFLPLNKVVLGNTDNDNNRMVMDFANAVTTESLVAGFLSNEGMGVIGNLADGQRGPLAYATVPPNLNSPNVTIWGVARGFPRKKQIYASAVLTVGTFIDQISVVDPYA